MSFPGKLLSFSIKTQIIWTVAFFSFIAVLLTFALINIHISEMKEELIKHSMEYYYSLQNEVLQNIISFQNFFLFNYEDTLKILICQLLLLVDISKYFEIDDINSFKFFFQNINYSNYSYDLYDNNEDSGITIYYINDTNYSSNEDEYNYLKITFRITKAFKSFRIPYYGDRQLFEGIIIYLNRTKKAYSSNDSFLYEYIHNEIGNDNLNEYYSNLAHTIMNINNNTIQTIIFDETIYPELILTEELRDLIKSYKKNKNIKIFSKFTPFLDYKKEYLHLIKIEDELDEYYVTVKLKSGLIDEIFLKLMNYFNITTLLVSFEDETVINLMSCKALLLKLQYYFYSQFSEKKFDKFLDLIEKNEEYFLNKNITVDKCVLDNENIEVQNYLRKYFIQNNSVIYDLRNGYNSSFIQLSNATVASQYMVTRYTYPDYFLMERKRPRYLIQNYIIVYTYMNFYFSSTYVNDKIEFCHVNFYAMTLANWYIWIIIYIIIFLLCLKISNDITNPLIKLKKAIDQMSFNDEKIFEYNDDDNINELFVMCKELVNKDELKKNLKHNYLDANLIEKINKSNEEENIFSKKRGKNRNFIFNNQMLEKNRKELTLENKKYNKEIVEYKDFKFLLVSRPRNQSRKRPNTINKLNKKLDLDKPIKSFSRFKTKVDYNINSKIRDNFLRESILSNSTKKENKFIFSEKKIIKEKINKNDNELNILLYELLYSLGRNMYRVNERELIYKKKYIKSDKSIVSNNDLIHTDSTNNLKNINLEEINNNNNNKYYNNADSVFDNNDNYEFIYEDKKSNNDLDKENNERMKEEYQIHFKKNDLYYKYLTAKTNWNNKFLCQYKNIGDLELDSNAMVEVEDDFKNIFSPLSAKSLKKKDLRSIKSISSNNIKKINQFKSMDKDIDIKSIKSKKSIIKKKSSKNINNKSNSLKKAMSKTIHILGKQITNPKQKKLGMRASISANMHKHKSICDDLEGIKRPKFNVESIDNQ